MLGWSGDSHALVLWVISICDMNDETETTQMGLTLLVVYIMWGV
jgi:hypothetical protein